MKLTVNPPFMQSECSQQPVTRPHTEPAESEPHTAYQFSEKIYIRWILSCNIILPSTCRHHKLHYPLQHTDTKFKYSRSLLGDNTYIVDKPPLHYTVSVKVSVITVTAHAEQKLITCNLYFNRELHYKIKKLTFTQSELDKNFPLFFFP